MKLMRFKDRSRLFLLFIVLSAISVGYSQALPHGDWVKHGFKAEDKQALTDFVNDAVKEKKIVGMSVLLLHKGEVIYEQGFGYADIKTGRKFQADDVCRIASISKPVIATLLVRLAQQGKVDLDVPIDRYLPEFKDVKVKGGKKAEHAPTIRQLLSHTGGMYAGSPWNSRKNQRPGVTLEKMVKSYAKQGLKYEPGLHKLYSGIGIDTAARVAEVVTGKYRDELIEEQIAEPLGLKTLTFCPDVNTVKAMPRIYSINGGRFKEGSHYIDRMAPKPKEQYSSSGGGIVASPQDLAGWLLVFLNGGKHNGTEYISDKMMKQMLTRNAPGNMGLGFSIALRDGSKKPAAIAHRGSTGTNCWVDFENDIIGITFLQSGRAFRDEVRNKFYEILKIEQPEKGTNLGVAAKDIHVGD